MAPKADFIPMPGGQGELSVVFDADNKGVNSEESKHEIKQAEFHYKRAMDYRAEGKFAEALPFFTQAIGCYERVYGNDHPFSLHCCSVHGLCLTEAGKGTEGEVLLRRAVDGLNKKLGPSHAQSLAAINNLALCLKAQKRPAEAAPLFRQALDYSEKTRGPMDINSIHIKNNLAICFSDMGQPQMAEPMIRGALFDFERRWGAKSYENRKTLYLVHNLATILDAQHKNEEAQMYYGRAFQGMAKILGNHHQATMQCAENLATMYDITGRGGEAYGLRKMVGLV